MYAYLRYITIVHIRNSLYKLKYHQMLSKTTANCQTQQNTSKLIKNTEHTRIRIRSSNIIAQSSWSMNMQRSEPQTRRRCGGGEKEGGVKERRFEGEEQGRKRMGIRRKRAGAICSLFVGFLQIKGGSSGLWK
jgi:hypothetical protein